MEEALDLPPEIAAALATLSAPPPGEDATEAEREAWLAEAGQRIQQLEEMTMSVSASAALGGRAR